MLTIELVEPLNIAITPIALLTLGAATVTLSGQPTGLAALRRWRPGWDAHVLRGVCPTVGACASPAEPADEAPSMKSLRSALPGRLANAVLTAGALFIGISMVAGDHYLLDSSNALQPTSKITDALNANRLLRYWPDGPEAVAQAYLLQSALTPSSSVKPALSWALLATRRDPADPELRSYVGTLDLQLGDLVGARQQFLQSVKLDRWTLDSLAGLGTVAADEQRWSESIYWYRRASLVAPQSGDLARQISNDEAHLKAT
jgi:hypothetical protein